MLEMCIAYLERHVNSVKLDLLLKDLNLKVDLVEGLRHGLELPNRVVDKSPALAPVMQDEAVVGLVVAVVRRSSKPEKIYPAVKMKWAKKVAAMIDLTYLG